MSEKKGLFASLFGGGKSGGCCNMEIVEEPEKKGSCCDMEVVEEPKQGLELEKNAESDICV